MILILSWVGWGKKAQDFIMLLRMACDVKLIMNYFWNFSFDVFRWLLTVTNRRKQNHDKGGATVRVSIVSITCAFKRLI